MPDKCARNALPELAVALNGAESAMKIAMAKAGRRIIIPVYTENIMRRYIHTLAS